MLFHLPRFVDKLYTIQPGENESYLPSPEALREKILVKVSDVNFLPLLEFYSRIPIQMLQCNRAVAHSQSLILCAVMAAKFSYTRAEKGRAVKRTVRSWANV